MFPQIFGKYVLTREIAVGGMARVFQATLRGAVGFEKQLCVKQIRPELASDQSFIQRFVAEAKTAVELSHANIVPVYELGAEQGTYYIAMELCEGVSLAQLLCGGALSPAEGAYIGVEICRALDYAHRKAGIVHRDVTPRNVMVDPEGGVRLIDFGIAASADAELPGQEPLFGSPGHMPPEQLQRGPLTPAADVFAVAALLVETWTWRAPFRRGSFEASVRALHEPVPDLAAADARLAPLAPILIAALSLEASERPQTAEELARPLREFLRQFDLGDIARRLGERVTEQLASSERVSVAPEPVSLPPREAAGATQTFAVRDALLEWTAKIDSVPPRGSDLSAASGAARPSSGWRGARSGPALAALGLALVVVAGGVQLARSGGSTPQAGAPDQVGAGELARAAGSEPISGPTALVALAAAAAPQSSPEPEPAKIPEPPALAAAVRTQAPERARVEARSATAPAPAGERARLHLSAEPRARVAVDAKVVGHTPIASLELSPGAHELVFENELLGERLEMTVTLSLKEPQRVHADFTSATPRVYVR